MSEGQAVPLERALEIYRDLESHLKSYADRFELAGSARRKVPEIHDLEIVAAASDDRLDEALEGLDYYGSIEKGKVWANRQKKFKFSGLNIDLYIVRPDRQWGPTMILRTGSKDANRLLVTRRGSEVAGTPYQGILPGDLQWHDASLWRMPSKQAISQYYTDKKPPKGALELNTPEELDVFLAVGLPYIEPEDRMPDTYWFHHDSVQPSLRLPPEGHTITIHTSRLSLRDPDVLDITVDAVEKDRATRQGIALSTLRSMVQAYKKKSLTPSEYSQKYRDLIAWRYQHHKQPFLDILARNRVVLTCFCKPGEFCHRVLAKDILTKITEKHNVKVIDGGELETGQTTDGEQQLELFGDF